MNVGVLLPGHYASSVGKFANRVESLGYSALWTSELWGHDALVQLGAAATTTEDIKLGTAIVNVFSRTPATLAMATNSIGALSDGRGVLGLGISTPRAINGIHGMEFEKPLRRMRETIEILHALTGGGEAASYEGDLLSVTDLPPLEQSVPIYVAALGPVSRRLTGEFSDGWLPHNIPYPVLDEAFEAVEAGLEAAGRTPADITVSPHLPTVVSDDPEEARALLRGHIAYYVGSGEGYRRAVELAFPDEAAKISSAWRDGERDRARSLVTVEMIDAIGLAAEPSEARDRLADRASMEIVDEIRLVPPAGTSKELVDLTLEELAPVSR